MSIRQPMFSSYHILSYAVDLFWFGLRRRPSAHYSSFKCSHLNLQSLLNNPAELSNLVYNTSVSSAPSSLQRFHILHGGAEKPGHWQPSVKNMANISQGSVATRVRCGGVFNDDFIANFLPCLTIKEFADSFGKWRSYCQQHIFDPQWLIFVTPCICVWMLYKLRFTSAAAAAVAMLLE